MLAIERLSALRLFLRVNAIPNVAGWLRRLCGEQTAKRSSDSSYDDNSHTEIYSSFPRSNRPFGRSIETDGSLYNTSPYRLQ